MKPIERLLVASKSKTGIRLSAEEVDQLVETIAQTIETLYSSRPLTANEKRINNLRRLEGVTA